MEENRLHEGDIVKHFKRDEVKDAGTSNMLYRILYMNVMHTETKEPMVVYQALYAPYKVFTRPQEMFLSEVDREKYPDVKQKYRLEKYNG